MISTVFILTISNNEESLLNIQSKFSLLFQEIENIGYKIENFELSWNQNNITEVIRNNLKLKDIVITVGGMQLVYNAASQIFNESLTKILPGILAECGPAPNDSKIIADLNSNYPVVCLHKMLMLHENLKVTENSFTTFLEYLKRLHQKPHYTKIFWLQKNNHSVKRYMSKKFEHSLNGLHMQLQEINDANDCKLEISSNKLDEIYRIQKELYERFQNDVIQSEFVHAFQDDLFNSNDENVQEAIRHIEQCFKTYGPENVFISFNGGKDCTVLLHLMISVLIKYYPTYKNRIFCMYVKSEKPFPEVDKFIEEIGSFYNLDISCKTSGIKEGLKHILEEKPNLKACLMGTRRDDPYSQNHKHFMMTDNGWPSLMRVSPLLDWDYGSIWDHLIDYKVPYCSLYDEGYTSLGNVDNTLKNSELLYDINLEKYLPAYKLFNGSKERIGRK